MATLKEVAATAQIVTQTAMGKYLDKLKVYIDTKDGEGAAAASAAIAQVQSNLDALIGAQGGDVDNVINTFNEIKAFLADYSEDDTLKNLIDAAVSAATTAAATAESNAKAYADEKVGTEKTRAEGAEEALSGRITTLENINVMTEQQANDLFEQIFNPQS